MIWVLTVFRKIFLKIIFLGLKKAPKLSEKYISKTPLVGVKILEAGIL